MLQPFRKLAQFSASSKGAKIVLGIWLIAVLIFSIAAPSANDYSENSTEGSVKENTPSEIAGDKLDEKFPDDDGLTALAVFHRDGEITDTDREKITAFSKWLDSDEKPEQIASALPYHEFPEEVQDQMYSDDGTTLIFNMAMDKSADSDDTNDAIDAINQKAKDIDLDGMQLEITGPAGISADTINMFKDADFVLMAATVVLIFIILIIIYRSPLLAITPLVIAGIVYGVVDRVIGIAGKNDWFTVDSSAVSIMLVLLFAVLTDYSLFVFSRYREELQTEHSKYVSMKEAIYHVSEPIFFSGGTIFLAMLTLFATVFKPYNHFAPVFATAVVIILLAGLTLIPSIFALMGRKAFWPFVPKVDKEKQKKHGIWSKVGKLVHQHPAIAAGVLIVALLIGVFNATQMKFSFNMMNSFPEDISSRQGFELLSDHYPPGELAPVNILLTSNETIETDTDYLKQVKHLTESLDDQEGVSEVSPEITDDMISGEDDLPRNFLSDDETAIKMQIVLDSDPYNQKALDTVEHLRNQSDDYLSSAGFDKDTALHYEGQTAEQLDVKHMNKRDTIVLFSVVTVLLALVLGFQTRSILLPVLMMSTILLSYFATIGFGWWIFEHLMGYDAISYRLPVYTFVFMVALGVDYNIMLISRIREKAQSMPWHEAVQEGVAVTGGVISSAGVILAATFAVLMSQPLQELFLFGFTMAMGILLDTFLIRGVLLPSLLILTKKK